MKLYLMRHGDYASSDIMQPLTPKGVDDVGRMVWYLKEKGVQVVEIWYSPKQRAVESAQIMGRILECHHLTEKECLMPNVPAGQVLRDLKQADCDIAIVSHLPFIPHLLSELFPTMSTTFFFPTAAAAVVECCDGQWEFFKIITLESI